MSDDKIVLDVAKLKQKSLSTTVEEVESINLKRRLLNAAGLAWTKGYGMAAVQIGLYLRYAVFVYEGKETELLNPEIEYQTKRYIHHNEGCLSLPKCRLSVPRFAEIWYTNVCSDGRIREFKAKGLKAAIIQHEIDHMNGITIEDRREEHQREIEARENEAAKHKAELAKVDSKSDTKAKAVPSTT